MFCSCLSLNHSKKYHRLHHLFLPHVLGQLVRRPAFTGNIFEHLIQGWIKPGPWLHGTGSQMRETDRQISNFHRKWQVLCWSQVRDARGMPARVNKSDQVVGKGFSEELTSKLSVAEFNHLWLWLQFPALRWESTSWRCFSEFLTLSWPDLVFVL